MQMLSFVKLKHLSLPALCCALVLTAPLASGQSADIGNILNSLPPAQAAEARAAMAARGIQNNGAEAPTNKAAPREASNINPNSKTPDSAQTKAREENVTGFAGRTTLRPFGESLMQAGDSNQRALDIPVPGDYRLGPGDTVLLQLFGKENRNYPLTISREGTIQLPEIGPLLVAGMSFENVSQTILERIAKNKIGVEASVTMGPLRSVQVFLVGDVRNPGSYTVPSLSTVTNALLAAGGVSQSGSLRRLEVRRNNKTIQRLDLYNILLKGDISADLRVQPGDVIFVPPVQKRVAISGEVTRPAIYELVNESSAADIIRLAGGLLPTAFADGSKLLRLMANDTRRVIDVQLADGRSDKVKVQNGDIIEVPASVGATRGAVKLSGAVERAGEYGWQSGMQLTDLLPTPNLVKPSAWRLLSLIKRTDAATGVASYLPVALLDVWSQRGDIKLESGDEIFVLDAADIKFLSSPTVQSALRSGQTSADCDAVIDLATVVRQEGNARFASLILTTSDTPSKAAACPALLQSHPELLPNMLDYGVVVRGEIKTPGFVLAAPGISAAHAIQALGNTTQEADPQHIELSRPTLGAQGTSNVERKILSLAQMPQTALQAGDALVVHKRYSARDNGVVVLSGEVMRPGAYDIVRGEKLSSLIKRAGGLAPQAYAYGTVFQRPSIREEKRQMYRRASLDMQNAFLLASTRRNKSSSTDATTLAAFQAFSEELKKTEPSGRIVVEADPTVLSVRPEFDIVLQAGDEIVVPRRPSHVAVLGEVLNPGALQFNSGMQAKDYLRAAGGSSQTADESRTFIILPNGSAEPIKLSSWNAESKPIPPGSVIYVPRDLMPFDATSILQLALEITKDVALTAAALITISN